MYTKRLDKVGKAAQYVASTLELILEIGTNQTKYLLGAFLEVTLIFQLNQKGIVASSSSRIFTVGIVISLPPIDSLLIAKASCPILMNAVGLISILDFVGEMDALLIENLKSPGRTLPIFLEARSLALVFALHHYKPTPLYVMDEIDAALDFKNVSIVAHYIKERTKNAQFIIISLRNNMFELADRLVGIYKTNNCTKSVTINPRLYSKGGGAIDQGTAAVSTPFKDRSNAAPTPA